jgi:hypothetical protein
MQLDRGQPSGFEDAVEIDIERSRISELTIFAAKHKIIISVGRTTSEFFFGLTSLVTPQLGNTEIGWFFSAWDRALERTLRWCPIVSAPRPSCSLSL